MSASTVLSAFRRPLVRKAIVLLAAACIVVQPVVAQTYKVIQPVKGFVGPSPYPAASSSGGNGQGSIDIGSGGSTGGSSGGSTGGSTGGSSGGSTGGSSGGSTGGGSTGGSSGGSSGGDIGPTMPGDQQTGGSSAAGAPVLQLGQSPILLTTTAVGQSTSAYVSVTNTGFVDATSLTFATSGAGITRSSDCPTTLLSGFSCTVTVTFTPTAAGAVSGKLTVTANSQLAASADIVAQGVGSTDSYASQGLAITPATLDFGTVDSASSSTLNVTVANTTSSDIEVSGISVTSGSAQFGQSNNCATSIAAGQSCAIAVMYTPAAVGAHSGSVQILLADGSSRSVAVLGKGGGAALLANPASLAFQASAAQTKTVVLSNPGTSALPATGLTLVGSSQFAMTGCQGTALAGGATCTVSVVYTPVAGSSEQHTATLSAVAGAKSASVSLVGALAAATITTTPSALDFGTVSRPSSKTLNVAVKNTGTTSASINAVALSGSTDFSSTNDCAALAAGASCNVAVTFTPLTAGAKTASLSITTSSGVKYVNITATGAQPAGSVGSSVGITPTTPAPDGSPRYLLEFGGVDVGASSPVRSVTFSNTGNGPLSVTGISVATGETDFGQSNNCGATIDPGSFCTINVMFTPSAEGARAGELAVLSDGGNFYISMTGSGRQGLGRLTASTSADFGVVTVTQSVNRVFEFRNVGTSMLAGVHAAVDHPDFSLIVNNCGTQQAPRTLNANASCGITVRYAPSTSGPVAPNLTVYATNSGNGNQTLTLAGEGQNPAVLNTLSDAGVAINVLNFGTVNADTLRVVRLSNPVEGSFGDIVVTGLNATAPYQIASVAVGSPVPNITCASQSNMRIPAGGACDVTLRLPSSTVGDYTASTYRLTVVSNAQTGNSFASGSVRIPLAGVVSERRSLEFQNEAGAAITELNFGGISGTTERTVRLANKSDSTGSLSVTNVTASATPYSVTLAAGGTGVCNSLSDMTLSAGKYCNLSVTMSAQPGTFTEGFALSVSSNATNSNTGGTAPASLPLKGSFGGFAIIQDGATRYFADGTFAQSCYYYRNPAVGYSYSGATGDGVYRIQPAGQAATDVYCDMTTAAGGWTLVMSAPGGQHGNNWKNSTGALNYPATPAMNSTTAWKLSDAFINAVPSAVASNRARYLVRTTYAGTQSAVYVGPKTYVHTACGSSAMVTSYTAETLTGTASSGNTQNTQCGLYDYRYSSGNYGFFSTSSAVSISGQVGIGNGLKDQWRADANDRLNLFVR